MKIKDEALWQELCAQLDADETGREFRKFLESWVDRAEEQSASVPPAVAIREALAQADDELGRVSAHFMGQMLCVIGMHWIDGDRMMEGLTPIERRVVEDYLVMKMSDLEHQAVEENPASEGDT